MPRPSRFGKTFNLSMLEYFFDISKKDKAHLFDGFKIKDDQAFCEAHQSKYAVINITFKNVKAGNWESCREAVRNEITDLYRKHKYLLNSSKLDDFEKKDVEKFILKEASDLEYAASLFTLSQYLYTHFEAEVIILIDEYDTPIIEGFNGGFYDEIIEFMRPLLGKALKDNDCIKKGLITGIMRIAKESLFSGLNNAGVYTLTSMAFSDKFGFTEEEVKKILGYFELESHFDNVKKWYDGYRFGNTTQIYNPWSIVNFISRYEEGFKPWWVNTGSDTLIRKRITEPDVENTYNTLQNLILGQTIERHLYENFSFPNFDVQKELLWTLLTFAGYLTVAEPKGGDKYDLRIPNYEIRSVFKDIVVIWLEIEYRVVRFHLERTVQHLLNNRLKDFEAGLRQIMGDTISYWDTADEPERVYQAYVLGLLAIIGNDYLVRSNRESGKGRYDVMIMPHDKSRLGILMEIKQITRNRNEKN
ncbi:MAG: AAA family ATPase, partial [Bacteroidota bacterium]